LTKTRLFLVCAVGLLGCASSETPVSSPPPPPEAKAQAVDTEDQDPVVRANRRYAQNDLDGALCELRVALDKDPSNARARYFYASFLIEKGELRGARRELEATLSLQSREVPAPIAWTRLGEVRERLGEHQGALEAYLKSIDAERDAAVHVAASQKSSGGEQLYSQIPHGSPEPFRNVARVSLFLGDVDTSLRAIEEARARAPRDPLTESLAVRAYQRANDIDRALQAARTFLEVAGEDAVLADRARELRDFVRTHAPELSSQEKATLIDYVRTALRPHLPGETPEDGFFTEHKLEKLLNGDDRAVFVTILPLEDKGSRIRGRGKGRSLAAGIAGAVASVKDNPRFDAQAARRSAIRIDVTKGELEPIVLSPAEYTPLDEPVVTALQARPPVEPGLHGIALRVDDRELFCLPGDSVTEDLPDVKAMLEFAAREAGLSPRVWEGASGRVFRFRTDSFCSPAPGASPVDLVRGEPVPFPTAKPESCAEGATLGALWLAHDLVPEVKTVGGAGAADVTTVTLAHFHYEYEARSGRFSDQSYNDVRHAGAALALVDAFARTGRPELRDAAELAAGWLRYRATRNGRNVVIVADDGKARLGTQALALLLEDDLAATAPAGTDLRLEERDGLARTIVAAMREDGSLPAFLSVGPGPNDGESQFFPGEAVLALARHFRATGERTWLDAATKAADARIREWRARASEGVPPLDAWLARALVEMDSFPELASQSVELASRRAFALEVANAIVAHQRGPETGDAEGGLAEPSELFPRGMPTASLGEGLVAVAILARARGLPEAGKLRAAVRAAASFALRHQYTARSSFYLAAPDDARGAFRSVLTSSKVRIDGVQHNVEFLLEVEKLLRE
jgi:tetratricopeptide (TPR) repeat protein